MWNGFGSFVTGRAAVLDAGGAKRAGHTDRADFVASGQAAPVCWTGEGWQLTVSCGGRFHRRRITHFDNCSRCVGPTRALIDRFEFPAVRQCAVHAGLRFNARFVTQRLGQPPGREGKASEDERHCNQIGVYNFGLVEHRGTIVADPTDRGYDSC